MTPAQVDQVVKISLVKPFQVSHRGHVSLSDGSHVILSNRKKPSHKALPPYPLNPLTSRYAQTLTVFNPPPPPPRYNQPILRYPLNQELLATTTPLSKKYGTRYSIHKKKD